MKVGIQLYSVRNMMQKDAKLTMKTVADLGNKYIETYCHAMDGFTASDEMSFGLGMDRRAAKEFLDATGIRLAGGHYYGAGDPAFEKMCDYYAALGGKQFGTGGEFFGDMDGLKRKMELMVKDAETARKYGLRYYYHNHVWEFQKFGGEAVWDIMLRELPADLVSFELDAFWAARSGMDPVEVIRKTGDRLIILHQKDFNGASEYRRNLWEYRLDPEAPITDWECIHGLEDDFVEVGTGVLPIQNYIDAGNESGVAYIVLEQDYTKLPELESIRVSMDAFRKFRGVEWE